MKELLDNPLYSTIVSPNICSDLCCVGLQPSTVFKWKQYTEELMLYTEAFDLDDYIKQSSANVDLIHKPLLVVPAFTTGDMEFALRNFDYKLSKISGLYKLEISRYFRNALIETDNRLPDVLGKMVHRMICYNKLDLKAANELLTYK